jgi:hypothetical protein
VERLVAIWNSLPGVTRVKKFKDHGGYPWMRDAPKENTAGACLSFE